MEAAWISEYKRETDYKRRRAILDREKEEHGEEKEFEVREKIWQNRYGKKNGMDIDYGIRGWVNLMSVKRRIYLPGEKKRIRREIDGIKKDWQFDLREEYGEAGEAAVYDELFNTALFYFDLCEKDKTYNSVVLGLGHITDEHRVGKIRKEVKEITQVIPDALGVTGELEPFIKATQEAFRFKYPSEEGEDI
ncbi:MAG: hypothetical protein K6E90_00565 [Lachnospiraceae bacterium]|nr:hypothetical protein [Lachnospiraceae bacterium]MCR5409454.1 hypothetical protein [Lachnospiraceae bacterium]